jgi:iron complex outermembrane receptor protein
MIYKAIGRVGCVVLSGWLGANACADSEDFFELSPEHLAQLKITAASAFTESELDSSATVSVVTREEWERRAARTLPDAVMHLPGVMLLEPPDGGMLIQVRSYDSTSLRGRATLVDGVPINTFAFGSEVFSNAEMQLPVMDNLQLVRGPSSILYGSDAVHSALLLSTYHNAESDNFEVSGDTGSRNYQRLALRGTQTFGGNQSLQFALGAAHQGDQGDEYTYPVGTGSAQASREQSYHSGTGMVRWQGSNDTVDYQLEVFTDQTSANEFPGAGTFIADVHDHDIADRNSQLWMVKGQLDGQLGGWDWQWDNYYWHNDYGQSYFLLLPIVNFTDENQQIVEHRYGSKVTFKRADLQALNARTQLALTAGTERQAIDDHDVTSLVDQVLPIPTPNYTGLKQDINSISLEGKTQWQGGQWQLIYGGRLDDYSSFGSQFSPRAGLIWMPSNTYSVKMVYGQAFRAPNANELRGTNFAAGDLDLKPETLDNYELTFTRVFSKGVVQLVGFKTRWNDRILLVNRAYTNAGESESRGAELSAKFDFESWLLEVSGAGIKNLTIDGPVRNCGCEPDMFPKWMASIGIGYRWPAQRLELFWSNRLHKSVRTGDDTQRGNVDDAGFFYRSDISLRQQWGGHWQGQLALRNLFDRNNVWPSLVNSNGGFADIPRQVALEIQYRGAP